MMTKMEDLRWISESYLENLVECLVSSNYKVKLDANVQIFILFLDAAVMGGTENYEKAFLTDKYLDENPDDIDKVNHLKYVYAYQVSLLGEGLK